MNIVASAASCGTIHYLASRFPFQTRHAANLLSCSIFQAFFVLNALRLYRMNPSNEVSLNTITNLEYLYGYFVYDLIYLISTDLLSPFIIHHLVGMTILHLIKPFGAPTNLLPYYNAICILGEVTSPFLNMRHFLKNTWIHPGWMRGIYYLYFASRIVTFPIVSVSLIYQLRSYGLAGTLFIIYRMSVFWFYRMNLKK